MSRDDTGSLQSRTSASARALLGYLGTVHEDAPARVLSGVFSQEGLTEVHAGTGQWASLLGVEYTSGWGLKSSESASDAMAWRRENRWLVEHAAAGGLVRILSHFPNPCRADFTGLRDKDADLVAILSQGTSARERWLALIDEVAAGLLELQGAGVTAIYGPLHEMNEVSVADSFWWGSLLPNIGAPGYAALWRDIVDRVCVYHGCRNVLWLWSPLGHCPVALGAYPGDDVVDVVGLDVYDSSLIPHTGSYDLVAGLGKPLLLSEWGPMKWNVSPDEQPRRDCRELVAELTSRWPKVFGFMFWGGEFLPTRQLFAAEMMAGPSVINREELRQRVV